MARRGTQVPPSEAQATASYAPGDHPLDKMLEDDDGDSYTEANSPLVKSIEQDKIGNDLKFNYRVPTREVNLGDDPPEGYVRTKRGYAAEVVGSYGPSQAQWNYFVDLITDKDLLASPKFFDIVQAMDGDEYERFISEQKARAFTDRERVRKMISALVELPWKSDDRCMDDRAKFRVKYTEVKDDRGNERRIGYLTDGELELPECKFALDTSADGRWANDVTFFRLWVGDRFGWKLYFFKSDDEIPIPVGQAVPILRRFGADMEAALALYGRESSRCGICSRKLTNDASRARGIGPICAGRWL